MSTSKIGVIIGSSRPSRIGANVTNWVANLLPKSDEVSYEVIDLKDQKLPFLDEIMPPMMGQYHNAHTKQWSDKIGGLDGFVIVTPEYNAGYPAILKNAIDYLKAEWQDKPVTIVSYGYSGGASANHQLVEVFTRIGSKLTETLPKLTFTQDSFGPDYQIANLVVTFGKYASDVTRAGQELLAELKATIEV